MERRSAIKSIGLGMGVTMSASAFTLFLHGCKGDAISTEDLGIFGTTDARKMVRQLVDAILPATDIPAASEVGVLDFISSLVQEVYEEKDRTKFVKGMSITLQDLELKTDKSISKLDDSQVAGYLEGIMGATADRKLYDQMLSLSRKAEKDVNAEDLDSYHQYSFLHALKSMTVNGYCQSEYIGEEVLQYLPVPGPYDGHLDYKGEKVYSMG